MIYFLYLFALIPFYLLGTLPTGRLIARQQGINLETEGSGNVGATNVARVIGKKAGILTLLVDIGKGFLAFLIAHQLGDMKFASLAGVAVVAGHCFSIPGKWRGGKGVATALGVFLYLSPWGALLGLAVFGVVFKVSRIVSLASVSAAIVIPIFSFIYQGLHTSHNNPSSFAIATIALLVVFRHKENLIRLTEGREAKFNLGTKR